MRLKNILLTITVFSIAMAFLESAVVVYLRELYYPGGFDFPIAPLGSKVLTTEIFRELATLIMLLTIGMITGRTNASKFAWFIYSFAIWDIFYYVFLKLLLNWPASLLTDDLLFLLPVIWIGPVITPVLISFLMIALALCILKAENRKSKADISLNEWLLLIVGSIITIISFAWEYGKFVVQNAGFGEIWVTPKSLQANTLIENFTPKNFNWPLFAIGSLIILSGIIVYSRRVLRQKSR